MIVIDWVFIGGATGIVGTALIERIADDFGFSWIGSIIKVALSIASIGASLYFIDIIAGVFLR